MSTPASNAPMEASSTTGDPSVTPTTGSSCYDSTVSSFATPATPSFSSPVTVVSAMSPPDNASSPPPESSGVKGWLGDAVIEEKSGSERSTPPPPPQPGVCTRIRRALTLIPPGATPPKWNIIFFAVFGLFVCVVNITMLFPYLPQMMRDMGYEEHSIGYYAGIVASSYFVGAFISSVLWGFLTDVWGRRPVLLTCLIGTCVFTVLFGFSTNIYWAFASRGLVGFFNGIIGTSKAILGDVSDNTNQAVGLAMLSVGWGSGLLLGPSIGGYLSEPNKKYPNLFPGDGTFTTYPYFFPNLVSAMLCILAIVVCFAGLTETRYLRARSEEDEDRETVNRGTTRPNEVPTDLKPEETDAVTDGPNELTPLVARQGPQSRPRLAMCRRLFASSNVIKATALFSIFSFACVALDETIALWAATKAPFGGLAFTTSQLGTMTGALNVPCLLMNVLVFPALESRLGSVRTYCFGVFVLCITTAAIPFINQLLYDSRLLWFALVITLVPNRMMYPICWSAADILINNSVYAEYLGLVNGVSMTFSFIFRSASPVAAGSIFSWSISEGVRDIGFPFDHHLVFFVIDISMVICFIIGLFTPRSLDKQLETYDRRPSQIAAPTVVVDGVTPTTVVPPEGVQDEDASFEESLRQQRLFHSSLSTSLSYHQGPRSRRNSRVSDSWRDNRRYSQSRRKNSVRQ